MCLPRGAENSDEHVRKNHVSWARTSHHLDPALSRIHSGSDVKKTAKNFEVSFLNFSNDVTFH